MTTTRLARLFVCLACLGIWLTAAGCADLSSFGGGDIVKNPVAPPPPLRMLQDAANNEHKSSGKAGVAQLGSADKYDNEKGDDELPAYQQTADASSPNPGASEKTGRASLGKAGSPGWKKAGTGQASTEIQQASFEEPAAPSEPKVQKKPAEPKASAELEPLLETQVAATVNGVPILVSDILEPFSAGLAKSAKQYSPQDMQKLRRYLVARHLTTHIEQQLLINALRTKLKEEQLQSVESQLDKAFAEELQKMYKQNRVATLAELDVELAKQNTTLQALRAAFRNRRLAEQWMYFNASPKTPIDRSQLLAYYREHQAEYEIPAKLKWQQISISSEKHGSEAKALAVAEKLLDELEAKADFAELAKKHSSGATASDGGHWDWTRKGSFADQELEKMLFDLPVNEITGPYRTKQGFDIVRVTERQDLSRKSFESVQDEIRRKLREAQFQAASSKLLKELHEHATVEILIKEEDLREAQRGLK